MLKKINKQREKIGKLMQKESDAADKLAAFRQELAEEKAVLDEMEKECLFSLMCGKGLSLEETIAILESRNLTMEPTESVAGDFTENVEALSDLGADQEMQDQKTMEGEPEPAFGDAGTSGSLFSRFGKKDDDEAGLWK